MSREAEPRSRESQERRKWGWCLDLGGGRMVVSNGTLFDMRTETPESGDAMAGVPLSRVQLVDRILSLNPTATPEFLALFTERSLGQYLEHLVAAQMPRGRWARRVRSPEGPAIVWREARD